MKHDRLLWIIDGLQSGSHLVAALRNDPEQLELYASQLVGDSLTDDDDWHPTDAGWGLVNEQLALISELLANKDGDGKGDPWRFPRPRSLAEEIREEYRQQEGLAAFAGLGFDLDT